MIDLHTHTIFSDGDLIPSELVRRAFIMGYRAIAITDHMDSSNMDFIIPRILGIAEELNRIQPVRVIPGCELTHVHPDIMYSMVSEARRLGARLVVVHGETIVEPVAEGTNRAAIMAGADMLAHPGNIAEEDAVLAAERGVVLEISARKGHSLSNGRVAQLAIKYNAKMAINTDAHFPDDLISSAFAKRVLISAGLDIHSISKVFSTAEDILRDKG